MSLLFVSPVGHSVAGVITHMWLSSGDTIPNPLVSNIYGPDPSWSQRQNIFPPSFSALSFYKFSKNPIKILEIIFLLLLNERDRYIYIYIYIYMCTYISFIHLTKHWHRGDVIFWKAELLFRLHLSFYLYVCPPLWAIFLDTCLVFI